MSLRVGGAGIFLECRKQLSDKDDLDPEVSLTSIVVHDTGRCLRAFIL